MIQVTHKTKPEQLRLAEEEIGDFFTEIYAAYGIGKACRALYESNVMPLNAELVQILAHPLSEIQQNRTWLFKLLNARNYMEVFENVIFKRFEVNLCMVTASDMPKAEDIPTAISKDISSFSVWVCYHGSAQESRTIKRKDIEIITKTERATGYTVFLSVMLRAALRFKVLCRKCLLPACGELIRKEKEQRMQARLTQEDDCLKPVDSDFGVMADALTFLKRKKNKKRI